MEFPFLYVGHGCAYARKCLEVVIVFASPVPASSRAAINETVPAPLGMILRWGDQWLHAGSDDTYEMGVKMVVDPAAQAQLAAMQSGEMDFDSFDPASLEPNVADWQAYEAQLETWIRALHATRPVQLFFKPTNPSVWDLPFSEWHEHSMAQTGALAAAAECIDDASVRKWVQSVLEDM